VRAGIPTHARARFEAQRDAEARRDRRFERWLTVGLTLAFLVVIGLWLGVLVVALHFLGKVW
jgi:ABC-type phosphate/phosphonate transport system permease subunit